MFVQCTRCLAEISFKTDPQSTDYVIEAGATRNFMAMKLAEEQAQRELEAEKEEERTNPMKVRSHAHHPRWSTNYFLSFSCRSTVI